MQMRINRSIFLLFVFYLVNSSVFAQQKSDLVKAELLADVAKVKAPQNISIGSTAAIRADTTWLSCEKVCIPGKASLELKLPVAQSSLSANKEIFSTWEKRLPIDLNSAPFKSKVSGKLAEAA